MTRSWRWISTTKAAAGSASQGAGSQPRHHAMSERRADAEGDEPGRAEPGVPPGQGGERRAAVGQTRAVLVAGGHGHARHCACYARSRQSHRVAFVQSIML